MTTITGITPLPWEYEHITSVGKPTQRHRLLGGCVIAAHDTLILEKTTEGNSPGTQADFAYIVKAANAYPKLVEALEGVTERMGSITTLYGLKAITDALYGAATKQALGTARALLTKLEER